MKYTAYSKTNNINKLLLEQLGLIEVVDTIVPINFDPDYEITDYDKDIDKDYYFSNYLKFFPDHNFVISCKFYDQFIINYEQLVDIEKNEEITLIDKEDLIQSLLHLDNNNPDIIDQYKFEVDMDILKLKKLKVKFINNTRKETHYEGSIFSASMYIGEEFLFSRIKLEAIKYNQVEFYKDLLGESYILMLENNNKLSSFILFSALESYVNYKLNNDRGRLKDKIQDLYKNHFGIEDISKHEIYSNVLNRFNESIDSRNTIAHGKNDIIVHNDDLIKNFTAVLTYIFSIEYNYQSFQDILNEILKTSNS